MEIRQNKADVAANRISATTLNFSYLIVDKIIFINWKFVYFLDNRNKNWSKNKFESNIMV
jgi:hypothetical protein